MTIRAGRYAPSRHETAHSHAKENRRKYEVIIRHHKGEWLIKLEDDEEFSTFYDQDEDHSIWTWIDETNQEMFTIRGELKG